MCDILRRDLFGRLDQHGRICADPQIVHHRDEKVQATSGSIELGTETESLIVLHGGAPAPVGQGYSGLYHVALHTSDQRDFARLLKRFSDLRYPCSPTDHTFPKAIYLDDPDGSTSGASSAMSQECMAVCNSPA